MILTAVGERKKAEAQLAADQNDAASSPVPAPTKKSSASPDHDTMSCSSLWPRVQQILEQFTQSAYYSYSIGSPSASHLLTLSKVNVFRAFSHTISILGLPTPFMDDDAISPFSTLQPGYQDHSLLPSSLQPTALQRTQAHHPWLDCFPLAQMRDNLVNAEGSFDDDQLCIDIMGFWDSSTESCGLLVWGEPTDPSNWEVTESFLRKWPWVVRGCPELMRSTNQWRRQRGEKMLFRYL